MDLTLVNNDPTRTLLVNTDGIPFYSIGTSLSSSVLGTTTTTMITRLERNSAGVVKEHGRAKTEIGNIQYHSQETVYRNVRFCLQSSEERPEFKLDIVKRELDSTELGSSDNGWCFIGPDERPYKWQIFIQYPVLLLDDNSKTPIARYRRAKLGIISKSRRPFLEIFPAGLDCLDLVVVTFVSYMVHLFPEIGGPAPSN